jgi:hypothetical protein
VSNKYREFLFVHILSPAEAKKIFLLAEDSKVDFEEIFCYLPTLKIKLNTNFSFASQISLKFIDFFCKFFLLFLFNDRALQSGGLRHCSCHSYIQKQLFWSLTIRKSYINPSCITL